jgi:hypothetical protein
MPFLKHIGQHGDRKVVVVFREVPNEPHMCLVVYPQVLNRHIHDPLMACIESDVGQSSENLAEALNRTYTTDGSIMLQKLHNEGMLKKINTEQVIMTPQPNIKIKLNELNKLLDDMQMGEEAVKKMAEMDASRGMQSPADVARRMRGNKDAMVDAPLVANSNDALGDAQLAASLKSQAAKMTAEANGLLAEAKRLMSEAESLLPSVPVKQPKVKKVKLVSEPAKTVEIVSTKKPRVKKANVT